MRGQITISYWLFILLVAFLAAEKRRCLMRSGDGPRFGPYKRLFGPWGPFSSGAIPVVESILTALNMLQLRRLLWASGGTYGAVPDETDVLAYYADAIAH